VHGQNRKLVLPVGKKKAKGAVLKLKMRGKKAEPPPPGQRDCGGKPPGGQQSKRDEKQY